MVRPMSLCWSDGSSPTGCTVFALQRLDDNTNLTGSTGRDVTALNTIGPPQGQDLFPVKTIHHIYYYLFLHWWSIKMLSLSFFQFILTLCAVITITNLPAQASPVQNVRTLVLRDIIQSSCDSGQQSTINDALKEVKAMVILGSFTRPHSLTLGKGGGYAIQMWWSREMAKGCN